MKKTFSSKFVEGISASEFTKGKIDGEKASKEEVKKSIKKSLFGGKREKQTEDELKKMGLKGDQYNIRKKNMKVLKDEIDKKNPQEKIDPNLLIPDDYYDDEQQERDAA